MNTKTWRTQQLASWASGHKAHNFEMVYLFPLFKVFWNDQNIDDLFYTEESYDGLSSIHQ